MRKRVIGNKYFVLDGLYFFSYVLSGWQFRLLFDLTASLNVELWLFISLILSIRVLSESPVRRGDVSPHSSHLLASAAK
jgi:hypothetical protein